MHILYTFSYTIIYKGECDMKQFKIPSIPPTTNKCIRFPNDLIDKVNEQIRGKDCTFTAFVVEAVRTAIENLEEQK